MTKPMSTALRSRRVAGSVSGRAILPATGLTLALALGLAAPALAQGVSAAPASAAPASAAPAPAASVPAYAPATPTGSASAPAQTATAAGGPISQADLQTALGREHAGKIEAHIDRLHSDLKITPAQETAWQAFAGTMRANAVQMEGAYAKRQQGYAGMNAVQDLQSYGEVEQTNARNIAQLLAPFQTLYAALSPQQQKLADGIFVRHIDKAVKKPG